MKGNLKIHPSLTRPRVLAFSNLSVGDKFIYAFDALSTEGPLWIKQSGNKAVCLEDGLLKEMSITTEVVKIRM